MMSKPTAGKPRGPVSNSSARAAQLKSNLNKWRPRDSPKMSAYDIIVLLKPRETLRLKRAFQAGDLGTAIAQYVGCEVAAILNIWRISPLDQLALPACDLHPLAMPSCGLHLTVTRRRTGSMRRRTSPPHHHHGFITNRRPA
ncbi:hypothetical protein MRX96_051329 [Rhipicephalus microplus]